MISSTIVRWLLALTALLGGVAVAHEVPADVKVQIFARPAGQTLTLLVRVPLLAMREVDFPRRGPGYLDLPHAEPALRNAAALWIADNLRLTQDQRDLDSPTLAQVRVSLPSDKSFTDFDSALAHLQGPRLDPAQELYWNQGLLDMQFDFVIRAGPSAFAVHPKLARLGLQVLTVLRFVAPDGKVRAFEFHGDPGLVHLDPSLTQAVLRFVVSGLQHILGGIDHLLFILCLVIPIRRLGSLALVVTGFTVAHSITLITAALGYGPSALWFAPLIEFLIALSIFYMAIENILGGPLRRRWVLTMLFGLVHGFGFAFTLRESLQFAGSHLLTSLLAFNLGVELGQLLVLALLVPLLQALFRYAVPERLGVIILSAIIAHTAWHWMLERGEQLNRFPLLDSFKRLF